MYDKASVEQNQVTFRLSPDNFCGRQRRQVTQIISKSNKKFVNKPIKPTNRQEDVLCFVNYTFELRRVKSICVYKEILQL